MITAEQKKRLIQDALDAQKNAFCAYSDFPVGAAILTTKGNYFKGVNVENVSYGLTICAERIAAGSAVADGETKFVAIAVASRGGVSPCGACRQFLVEFLPKKNKDDDTADIIILMVNSEQPENVTRSTLRKLLPKSFERKGLEAGQRKPKKTK